MADQLLLPFEQPINPDEARKARRRAAKLRYALKTRDQKNARQRERRAAMTDVEKETERSLGRQRAKRNRAADLEGHRARDRAFYQRHRLRQIAEARTWALANPERRRAAMRQWYQRRYPSDQQLRIAMAIRSRVSAVLRGTQRPGSAIKDLGCSISEFMAHIESLWLPGMTWENRGRGRGRLCWHLDHIRPLASFALTDRDQFLAACHYTNYQPLWAADNIRKVKRL